jgi:hypothetical protein
MSNEISPPLSYFNLARGDKKTDDLYSIDKNKRALVTVNLVDYEPIILDTPLQR